MGLPSGGRDARCTLIAGGRRRRWAPRARRGGHRRPRGGCGSGGAARPGRREACQWPGADGVFAACVTAGACCGRPWWSRTPSEDQSQGAARHAARHHLGRHEETFAQMLADPALAPGRILLRSRPAPRASSRCLLRADAPCRSDAARAERELERPGPRGRREGGGTAGAAFPSGAHHVLAVVPNHRVAGGANCREPGWTAARSSPNRTRALLPRDPRRLAGWNTLGQGWKQTNIHGRNHAGLSFGALHPPRDGMSTAEYATSGPWSLRRLRRHPCEAARRSPDVQQVLPASSRRRSVVRPCGTALREAGGGARRIAAFASSGWSPRSSRWGGCSRSKLRWVGERRWRWPPALRGGWSRPLRDGAYRAGLPGSGRVCPRRAAPRVAKACRTPGRDLVTESARHVHGSRSLLRGGRCRCCRRGRSAAQARSAPW